MDYINPFVDEKAFILLDKKVNLPEQKKWLEGTAKSIDSRSLIFLVAWVGKELAGDCEVRRGRHRERFTVSFGLSVSSKYRGLGLGKALLRKGIAVARSKFKAHKITLEYLEGNVAAKKLYESLGFVEVCRLKERAHYGGKFLDSIIMDYVE